MTTSFLRVFNFGIGFLGVGVTSTSVTLTLQEGDLANFPTPGASADRYRIVVGREVMEVTGRDASANTLTVVRGQEGTTALSHLALAVISIRLTAAGVLSMQDAINALEQGLNKIQIRIDGAADTGDRPRIQFVSGAGITITAVDSEVNNEVVVTITNDNP